MRNAAASYYPDYGEQGRGHDVSGSVVHDPAKSLGEGEIEMAEVAQPKALPLVGILPVKSAMPP